MQILATSWQLSANLLILNFPANFSLQPHSQNPNTPRQILVNPTSRSPKYRRFFFFPFAEFIFCSITASFQLGPKEDRRRKKGLTSYVANPLILLGAPGGIRTPGLWIRSPTLYPAELRAQVSYFNYLCGVFLLPLGLKKWDCAQTVPEKTPLALLLRFSGLGH